MDDASEAKMFLKIGGAVVLLILGLIFKPFFTVSAGEVGVTFNRFSGETRSYSQGTHFRIPLVCAVYDFDVKTQRIDVDAHSASKDLQKVHVVAMLNSHLDYTKVNELFVKVGEDYKEKVVEPATQEVIKAETAKLPVEEIIVRRDSLRSGIENSLREKLKEYNIILENVNLVNIDFDEEFNKVVEQKQIEEQRIKTAEYQKRQAIEFKEKTILEAQAEAEKQRLMKSNVNESIVSLEWIKKWNGVLPSTVLGDKNVMMVNPK